eukprot:TRINITY_DN1321_c1_g4_i1.p1 TRINITY_DN1321_c1_g4~~TRINITY_DN1321_c1_g4_i1.p1  ORF type:complete len:564 (+),score=106.10 TRINITY_DN1321_c1_g4_i1:50-1741(+)
MATELSQEKTLKGFIRQINHARGFGHLYAEVTDITREPPPDLYFYHTWCRAPFHSLQEGQAVEFRARPSLKKAAQWEAYDIRVPGMAVSEPGMEAVEAPIDLPRRHHSEYRDRADRGERVERVERTERLERGERAERVDYAFPSAHHHHRHHHGGGRRERRDETGTEPFVGTAAAPGAVYHDVKGVVRVVDPRGFGHITPAHGSPVPSDMFFHYTYCTETPFSELHSGTPVMCHARPSEKKADAWEAFHIVKTATVAPTVRVPVPSTKADLFPPTMSAQQTSPVVAAVAQTLGSMTMPSATDSSVPVKAPSSVPMYDAAPKLRLCAVQLSQLVDGIANEHIKERAQATLKLLHLVLSDLQKGEKHLLRPLFTETGAVAEMCVLFLYRFYFRDPSAGSVVPSRHSPSFAEQWDAVKPFVERYGMSPVALDGLDRLRDLRNDAAHGTIPLVVSDAELALACVCELLLWMQTHPMNASEPSDSQTMSSDEICEALIVILKYFNNDQPMDMKSLGNKFKSLKGRKFMIASGGLTLQKFAAQHGFVMSQGMIAAPPPGRRNADPIGSA